MSDKNLVNQRNVMINRYLQVICKKGAWLLKIN
jgi:hypothetical protein